PVVGRLLSCPPWPLAAGEIGADRGRTRRDLARRGVGLARRPPGAAGRLLAGKTAGRAPAPAKQPVPAPTDRGANPLLGGPLLPALRAMAEGRLRTGGRGPGGNMEWGERVSPTGMPRAAGRFHAGPIAGRGARGAPSHRASGPERRADPGVGRCPPRADGSAPKEPVGPDFGCARRDLVRGSRRAAEGWPRARRRILAASIADPAP